MEKLLIGAIAGLILLAFIPIKDTPATEANMTPVSDTITNDTIDPQALFISLNEIQKADYTDFTKSERKDADNEDIEKDQETEDTDRVVFISIGSMVLIGILLLLPL